MQLLGTSVVEHEIIGHVVDNARKSFGLKEQVEILQNQRYKTLTIFNVIKP